MQLLAMKTDGILRWTGLENDFASELALDLDEDTENVAVTLQYLLSCGLAETDDNTAFFFPYAVENTGSEVSSTIRSRESRARAKALQCNTSATPLQQNCNVEKEIDIEIEKEIEKEHTAKPRTKKHFVPPTLAEVEAYVRERNSSVDPKKFWDYFNAGDWMDSEGKPVLRWKQKLITWEGRSGNGKPVSNDAQASAEERRSKWGIKYDNEP